MRPQLTAMRFMTYLIAGFCTAKWFETCSAAHTSDTTTSKAFETDEMLSSESSRTYFFPHGDEDRAGLEPVVSPHLLENVSWNGPFLKNYTRKRDLPSGLLNEETKMKILQLHNIYRGNVTPPAGDMQYLEWDDELAQYAQIWSDRCEFKHGFPDGYPELIGQNLYKGTDHQGFEGIWLWKEESHHYDLRTQVCSKQPCNHYTQLAWAPTNKLGCGISLCREPVGNRTRMFYLLTCHYYPQSLKGIQLYKVAKPCSQCLSAKGDLCVNNLCISWDQCKRNPSDCKYARCELECLNCGRLDKENCLCECMDGWDSRDCSNVCRNENRHCGKSPGWPSKAACSLNGYAVAKTYCRKMCEQCHPADAKVSKHVCCNGIICDHGYVLDTDSKSCNCTLLCPGPVCDASEVQEKVQASLESSAYSAVCSSLVLWILVFFWTQEKRSSNYLN